MKKVRTIKISVTTREILIGGLAAPESSAETELQLCPACNSRIAETVRAAVAALSETEDKSETEYEFEMKENLAMEREEI